MRLNHGAQILLCLFSSFLESLQGHAVCLEVDAVMVGLEIISHPVNDDVIEVIAAQVVVTGCRQNFESSIYQVKDRYIECTAAKVEDQNLHFLFGLVDTEGKRRRRRFVDDSFDVESGDLAGILCHLTLCIVEVCRNGDDGLGDRFTQIAFSIFLHILQDHR